jgi:hypothetical protein
MAIDSVAISTTSTTVFTAVGNKMIATMIFCNTETPDINDEDAGATFLDLHLVKNGGTATLVNKIVSALRIPAGETVFFDSERVVLENGDSVVALTTSPAVLSCTISTVDI